MEVKIEAKVRSRTTYHLDITATELIELLRMAGYKIPQEAHVRSSGFRFGIVDKESPITVSWG